jgi:hypothetical protein
VNGLNGRGGKGREHTPYLTAPGHGAAVVGALTEGLVPLKAFRWHAPKASTGVAMRVRVRVGDSNTG